MKTFTIDADNSISVFATPEEAAATTATPFDTFVSQNELADLAATWPPERLVAIWNSLPGVKPVKTFKNAKLAAGKIWERIQSLGEPAKAEPKPKAKGAPGKGKGTKKTTPAKKAPRAAKSAKKAKATKPESGPCEGSKTAQVVAMLQRKNGAALADIMDKMGWQKTPRPRVHGRDHEKGRIRNRIVQIRQGRAHLPDQPVASNRLLSLPARHCRGGLFCFRPRFLPDRPSQGQALADTPTLGT